MDSPAFARDINHPSLFSPAEAFAAVVLAAVASDGYLASQEVDAVMSSLSRMHLYEGRSVADLQTMMQKLHAALQQAGSAFFLNTAKDALPPELHETAFAVAADLVLSDGVVATDEQAFLALMCQTFELTVDRAQEILSVMVIKNRG
jgi:hypothetical protein